MSVILFGVCIIIGCMSLEYGRNDIVKDVETVEKQALPLKDIPEVSITPVLEEEADVVDKSLPVLEVVEDDEDKFDKISKKIDTVIKSG